MSSMENICLGHALGEVLIKIFPSSDQALGIFPSLHFSLANFIISFRYLVKFSLIKISCPARLVAEQLGKRVDRVTFLSWTLALYNFVLSLWFRNLAMIGFVPFFLYKRWEISILSCAIWTPTAVATLQTTSSVEMPMSSRMPWIVQARPGSLEVLGCRFFAA